ncbi:restriction endonuclease subunit S [Microbulbifer sp. CnH-101-G]|uniref:restriction endonuclease subunit S n=1 Tax=Microbulbifer sp. CnH-101-G TaxID=3243393 RepID=UPI0040395AD5
MSWLTAKLADVAPARALKRPIADFSEKAWHLNLDQIEAQTGRVLSEVIAPVCDAGTSTYWFDDTHVLYSKLRPYLNKVVLPQRKGIATTELVPLCPDPDRLDRSYLAYYLRSNHFVSWVSAQVAGAKMPRVSMKVFWDHEIPLPPLKEQKRIAAILDKADNLRRKRQQAIQLADEFLRSVFLDMFGDPVTNPKGWAKGTLGKYCAFQGGFAFKSKDFSDGGIPLVKITNVHFENLKWDDVSYLPKSFIRSKPDFVLVEDDLLMAMTRPIIKSLSAVKVVEVKKKDLPCILNQRVGRFKGYQNYFTKEFLKYFLYSDYFKSEIEKLCSVALQPNVSAKQVESIACYIPEKQEQERFSDIVKRVEKITSLCGLASQEQLFESLKEKAFSGNL